MQGTRYGEQGQEKGQIQNEKNRQQRIDFVMLVATTPSEEFGPRIQKHWTNIESGRMPDGIPRETWRGVTKRLRENGEDASNLFPAESEQAGKMRSFLENPEGSQPLHFIFETEEEAWDYGCRLNALLERSGLLEKVNIEPPSEADGGWQIVLMPSPQAEKVAKLEGYEQARLARREEAPREEKPRPMKLPPVQEKKAPAPEKKDAFSDDPLGGLDLEGSETKIAKSPEEMRSILSRKFTDSDREVLPIIPKRGTIEEIIRAIQDSEKLYSFEITGQTRRNEVEIALNKCGATYRIEELGPRKFRVTINSQQISEL